MAEPVKKIPEAEAVKSPSTPLRPPALDALEIGKRFIARYPKIMAKLAE